MNELPKNFPEYSIMYKSILKQIQQLNFEKNNSTKEKERQREKQSLKS